MYNRSKYIILLVFVIRLNSLFAVGHSGESNADKPVQSNKVRPMEVVWKKELTSYNQTWDKQSENSGESMPLAGGVMGVNVWVANNELLFLLGSPNTMDEKGLQVKLGLIRMRFSPVVFQKDFRQTLDLERSEIVISGKTVKDEPVEIRLWNTVDNPEVHVELISQALVEVTANFESWSGYESKFTGKGIQWVKRLSEKNTRLLQDVKAQGVSEYLDRVFDPLSKLTMGGFMSANDMVFVGKSVGAFNKMKTEVTTMKSRRPIKKLNLLVSLRMEQDPSILDWETKLYADHQIALRNEKKNRKIALNWWRDFWNRSYIVINPQADKTDKAWQIGQNYQLFRYQLAANRNGRAMTLFNGGVFNCTDNPDSRMWEFCQFMAQNQRLVYWPMLKSGDYDLLKVGLDFYKYRVDINRLHTKKFFGVDGLAFPEPYSIFGLDAIGTDKEGRSAAEHLRYHYTSSMEFALMMLENGKFTGKDVTEYLPVVEGILSYYDQYYQKEHVKKTGKTLDQDGKLVIYPSDATEIYHGCTNNTDVVSGLMALTKGLLELPKATLSDEKRLFYDAFLKRIPPVSLSEVNGVKLVAAAKSYESVFYNQNMEFPNMYVCFPFNYYFMGRDDDGIQWASNTWDHGAIRPEVQKQAQCWYQSAINLARLGRTADAKSYIEQKFLHQSLKFPAFWKNPGFCQAPDTDHGGAGMIGLQEMLMQTDGKRILLGVGWPKEWECDFKLHAPYQTTVEGSIRNGKIEIKHVFPATRKNDVELYPLKATG